MIGDEEKVRKPYLPTAWDEERNRTALDKAFPDEQSGTRRDILKPMITRWNGPTPNYYDGLGYTGYVALWDIIQAKSAAQIARSTGEPNGHKPSGFKEAFKDPVLEHVGLYSISLGGKGRKEAVELGKVQAPGETPSRWSWRQKG